MPDDARPIRATATWLFHCRADPAYFLEWAEVPETLKDELKLHGGLACDGGGSPGPWCIHCRFGSDEEGNNDA